ncbi:MAG: hemolysin III family protein [Myxococcales bacterium]
MADRPMTLPGYTVGEEIANAVTHGLGAAVAVAGLTLMVVFAWLWGDGWCLAGAIVFGVALILQYVFSALYHAIPFAKAKHVLKVLDHTSIYLLIAGTYTPFTLITLRDVGGMWLFAAIWSIAVAGVAAEAFWVYRPRWVSAAGFIPMGWSIIFLINPLLERLPRAGIGLLVAGGLVYTLGTIFYVLKKVKWMHAVWHLFVIGGSVCHFLAVLMYVLPGGKA